MKSQADKITSNIRETSVTYLQPVIQATKQLSDELRSISLDMKILRSRNSTLEHRQQMIWKLLGTAWFEKDNMNQEAAAKAMEDVLNSALVPLTEAVEMQIREIADLKHKLSSVRSKAKTAAEEAAVERDGLKETIAEQKAYMVKLEATERRQSRRIEDYKKKAAALRPVTKKTGMKAAKKDAFVAMKTAGCQPHPEAPTKPDDDTSTV